MIRHVVQSYGRLKSSTEGGAMPLYMDLHSLDVVTFEDVCNAATTVQGKAHGLVAHEIYEMQEGS